MARKTKVELKPAELQSIRSFYEQQKIQLLTRLQHVDQVLARLGGGSEVIMPVAAPIEEDLMAVAAPAERRKPGRPRKAAPAAEAKTKKAGRPKKRGPKSVWGNFIMRRLRQCNRPLSYSELVRDAMVMHNLPESKEKNAKASVLNAAFRLRTHLKKIDTVGLPGKKERFLVLTGWMNAEGGLKAPYDKAFAAVAEKPMDDRGRKPRRPSAASRAEAKVKARMDAGDQAAKPAVAEAAKPAAKKPATRKAAAKPAAKKPAAKPAAKKAAAKPAVKKAAAKPVAKPAAKPAAKKAASKPAAKPAAKKVAAKPAAKKAAAKPAAKKAAAKPAAKKTAAKPAASPEPAVA